MTYPSKRIGNFADKSGYPLVSSKLTECGERISAFVHPRGLGKREQFLSAFSIHFYPQMRLLEVTSILKCPQIRLKGYPHSAANAGTIGYT